MDMFLISELASWGLLGIFLGVIMFVVIMLGRALHLDTCNKSKEALVSKGYFIAGVLLFVLGIIITPISGYGDAVVIANKNRILAHYTSIDVAKEQIEPLVKEYLEAIRGQIEQPNINLNLSINKSADKVIKEP